MKNEKLKPVIIGALLGLAVWGFILLMASIAADNEWKTDFNGKYVAVYPSVWKCMQLLNPIWWILAILSGVGGGALAGYKKDDASAGQIIPPTALIGLVAVLLTWGFMHFPTNFPQDFTHKTIPVEQFSEDKANKGGYDNLFYKLEQPDELYNGPAVFANPQ